MQALTENINYIDKMLVKTKSESSRIRWLAASVKNEQAIQKVIDGEPALQVKIKEAKEAVTRLKIVSEASVSEADQSFDDKNSNSHISNICQEQRQ